MKKTLILLLIALLCLSCAVGCKKEEKTVATEAPVYAEETLKAYRKLYGQDAVADGSIIRATYNGENTYLKLVDGKLSAPNPDIILDIRGEHMEITPDDVPEINKYTVLYLAVGSKLPDGYADKDAKAQAEEALRLYQMPVKDGDPNRVMPDEAVFVVELNGDTYYFMCMDDKIKDQSQDYKQLIESDKYVLDESDFFSFTVTLYFNKETIKTEPQPDPEQQQTIDPQEQARLLVEQAIMIYELPKPEKGAKPEQVPDGAIFVIKYEGKTYYFMCEDGAIKDQSKDYKDLIKSDEYEQDKDHEYSDGIKLYIKK